MFKIVICEKDPLYLQFLINRINYYFVEKVNNTKIILATMEESEILAYTKKHGLADFYLLTMGQKGEQQGIALSKELRKLGFLGNIALISESKRKPLSLYTHMQKVNPAEYIYKRPMNHMQEQVLAYLEESHKEFVDTEEIPVELSSSL